ncbi:PEGA domain-containing protein [Candidatus Daviesbacteria bacterium]|nr:PEGA domain-containing protein [Candidatus Daviesbacteria bacterium]
MVKNLKVSRNFLFTLLIGLVIAVIASVAIFLAKGYRFSPEKVSFSGTGIISITSVPDQASVFLDDHLITATNANINSLVPKTYKVKIQKDGFIAWEKQVEVKVGLVTDIKATLFPAIPTVYPLTYNGVLNPVLSPDGQKLVFVVPVSSDQTLNQAKKSGIWVWTMSEKQLAFARGNEPHQIMQSLPGLDFSKGSFHFSPDSSQLLFSLPDRNLLLDPNQLNDNPRDITPILNPTLNGWKDEAKVKDSAAILAIKDLNLRNIASNSATLIWSPDETKFLYSDQKTSLLENYDDLSSSSSANLSEVSADKNFGQTFNFKIADLTDRKTYNLPKTQFVAWLPDSRHLVLVNKDKISVVEFDGSNQSVIFAGNFNPKVAYPWPDGSRLMIISSLPTPTAEQPNLYGINLK